MKLGDKVYWHKPTGKSQIYMILRETPKQWILNNGIRFWKHNKRQIGYPWPMLGSFITKTNELQ